MTLLTVCDSRSVWLLDLCEGGQTSFNREEIWLKKMGVGMACKLCYPFCKKGRNKILHFNVLLCGGSSIRVTSILGIFLHPDSFLPRKEEGPVTQVIRETKSVCMA